MFVGVPLVPSKVRSIDCSRNGHGIRDSMSQIACWIAATFVDVSVSVKPKSSSDVRSVAMMVTTSSPLRDPSRRCRPGGRAVTDDLPGGRVEPDAVAERHEAARGVVALVRPTSSPTPPPKAGSVGVVCGAVSAVAGLETPVGGREGGRAPPRECQTQLLRGLVGGGSEGRRLVGRGEVRGLGLRGEVATDAQLRLQEVGDARGREPWPRAPAAPCWFCTDDTGTARRSACGAAWPAAGSSGAAGGAGRSPDPPRRRGRR
jgi:hypothetical protein